MRSMLATAAVGAMLAAAPSYAQTVPGDCPSDVSAPASGIGGLLRNLRDVFSWNPFAGRYCSQGSYGLPGWAMRDAAATSDGTTAFREAHEKAKDGRSPLPANAKDYVYVLVGGLYTEHFPGYMRDNIARLESRGLATRRVDLDTDAGVETNAASVRDAVLKAARETGKKVVLIGHSKGGVDSSAALALHPELVPHVRAFVAMQSPYGGSPIAQDVQGCPRLKDITDGFVSRVWNGSPQAMIDLTYDARKEFLGKNPFPASVPTVSLATSRTSFGTVMRKSELYLRTRYGLGSDGLVVPDDAIIPGSTVIRLDDMDHAEATNTGVWGFREYHPGDVTEALVAVALSR